MLIPEDRLVNLTPLADYLTRQREAILSQWRTRIQAQGDVTVLLRVSREEFYDHIPEFLVRVSIAFRGDPAAAEDSAERHGAQRWRLGMNIEETAREWSYLHRVLVHQIGEYHQANPSLGATALEQAYDLLATLIHEGFTRSIAEFHAHHRLEAEARMRDLEAAIELWDALETRRREELRQVCHDLSGGLSIIQMAGLLLRMPGPRDEIIEAVEDILYTTGSMNRLLNDLRDLARLEAGQDQLEITSFDAADLLHGLGGSMRPIAQEKGLALTVEGETPLEVRGDRTKVQRIAQNLILNALTYTQAGRVEVGWRPQPPARWMFYVRDTGPGLPSNSAGAVAQGLEEASRGDNSPQQVDVSDGVQVSGTPGGEGIGLVIVHRLCELLDGVIEVESEPGRGTEFRILLPDGDEEA